LLRLAEPRSDHQSKSHPVRRIRFIDLVAGSTYYFRASVHPGWVRATTKVEIISADTGRALLKQCEPPDGYRTKTHSKQ
jgi:hypothetical protein